MLVAETKENHKHSYVNTGGTKKVTNDVTSKDRYRQSKQNEQEQKTFTEGHAVAARWWKGVHCNVPQPIGAALPARLAGQRPVAEVPTAPSACGPTLLVTLDVAL